MAKKHKKQGLNSSSIQIAASQQSTFSPLGKKMIAGGICLLIAGFFVLTRTDPYGRNWASTLAPFLILGAYGIIAAGIFCPHASESAPSDASPPASSGPERDH